MHAEYIDGKILIFESYIHKETIKEISGRIWDVENKAWIIPCSKDNLYFLQMIGCKLDDELVKKAHEEQQTKGVRDKHVIALEPMPIKASPYSHQVEAYNRACSSMGIFKRANSK